MKNVNSVNELAKEFENIVLEESNLIRKESIVALKHITTGKYLSSSSDFHYTTGSESQLEVTEPDPNSLWKISFGKDKSPSNNHTEVSCNNSCNSRYNLNNYYWFNNWKFNYSKVGNHQGYLKSNDIVNLSIEGCNINNGSEFLRSHDIQFTVEDDTFQEVVCHNERLGGNDEWRIELIYEVKIF